MNRDFVSASTIKRKALGPDDVLYAYAQQLGTLKRGISLMQRTCEDTSNVVWGVSTPQTRTRFRILNFI